MNRRNASFGAVIAVFAATALLSGCGDNPSAEKAGKSVDNAVEKAGEGVGTALNKAGDAVKDATKK